MCQIMLTLCLFILSKQILEIGEIMLNKINKITFWVVLTKLLFWHMFRQWPQSYGFHLHYGKFASKGTFGNTFIFFLGPHLQYVEFPMLLGLNRSYGFWSTPQPQQLRIWAMSVTYNTSHGNTRSLSHCLRPGIEPITSWILVGFISAEPQWELLNTFWLA